MQLFKNMKKGMLTYMVIISLVSIGLGLSDSVFSNYFKDAYNVTAVQRGFIEFPRELPGILCVLLISGLSFLGDIRLAVLAQAFSFAGLVLLGLITPSFAIMVSVLFFYSMGTHLFLPLSDGIGLSLIEPSEKVGKRMGQYNGIKTFFTMLASAFVFVSFKLGWFSFTTKIKWVFLLGAVFFLFALVLFLFLQKSVGKPKAVSKKSAFLFRKQYKLYYILAILNGVQKQIMAVYGPWVLIDLLNKKADTIALLGIAGAFAGIFFMPAVGRWLDRFGVKKMMYVNALAFIFVYISYGVLSGIIADSKAGSAAFLVVLLCILFVIDRMTMQMSMVRVVYLNKIALNRQEVTRTLSMGISMDHVVSILFAYLGGLIWVSWGPQYVFYIAAAFSLVNVFVAAVVKIDAPQEEKAAPASDNNG